MTETVSIETVARALNVSVGHAHQLVLKHGMPRVSRGKYELGRCMSWYVKYLQAAIERRRSGEEVSALTAQRIRTMRARNEKLEAENQRRREDLIPLGIVTQLIEGHYDLLAKLLRNYPQKVAAGFPDASPEALANLTAVARQECALLMETVDADIERMRRRGIPLKAGGKPKQPQDLAQLKQKRPPRFPPRPKGSAH